MTIKLRALGRNLPNCPECQSGNALFDRFGPGPKRQKYFECRDCGYRIDAKDVTIDIMQPDEHGMGKFTTYHVEKTITGMEY